MGRLEGARALVTGGTTGLGLAIAERFLAEGARVAVTGRDEDLGRAAEARLREAGPAWFLPADAADPAAVERSVADAVDRLEGLDVLVNNAGVGVVAGVLGTPVEDFDRVMGVNVRGAYLYARAAFPHLAASRGCMIHIASDAGVWGESSIAVYSVSKAAAIMLGKMLAVEGGPSGVRSNVICPGDIWPGMRHMGPPGQTDRGEQDEGWPVPPIGRIGRAEDVAAAAVYFASAEAEFVTGAVLLVDGGMTAGYLQREQAPPYPPAR